MGQIDIDHAAPTHESGGRVNDTENLKRTDFFIGPADRDAVGKALLSDFHVDGDFVVRESESAVGTLTLVCRMPGSKLLQKRIVCSQGIYSFQGSAMGFATVAALLAAERGCVRGVAASLGRPRSTKKINPQAASQSRSSAAPVRSNRSMPASSPPSRDATPRARSSTTMSAEDDFGGFDSDSGAHGESNGPEDHFGFDEDAQFSVPARKSQSVSMPPVRGASQSDSDSDEGGVVWRTEARSGSAAGPTTRAHQTVHSEKSRHGSASFECKVTIDNVSVLASKLGLVGECNVQIQNTMRLQLRHMSTKVTHSWPIALLRRYGRSHEAFWFEAGKRCKSGEGKISLRAAPADVASLGAAVVAQARRAKQVAVEKIAKRNAAMLAVQQKYKQEEEAKARALEAAAKRHAEQAREEARRRLAEREAKEAAARKAAAKAEAEKQAALQQAKKNEEKIYADRVELLRARAQRQHQASVKAKNLTLSKKAEVALTPKVQSNTMDLFGTDAVAPEKWGEGKSKIWKALNPQPLYYQTAKDRREQEEVVEFGVVGARNFNAMKDVLTSTVVEEEGTDESNDVADSVPVDSEIVNDVEDELEYGTEDESESESDGEEPDISDFLTKLDENRKAREAEAEKRKAELRKKFQAEKEAKQREIDKEIAIINEEKRLEREKKEKEKEAAVKQAQERASELVFDFSFG